jgi:hypothetical protein
MFWRNTSRVFHLEPKIIATCLGESCTHNLCLRLAIFIWHSIWARFLKSISKKGYWCNEHETLFNIHHITLNTHINVKTQHFYCCSTISKSIICVWDSQFFNKKITKNALVGLIKILSYKNLCGLILQGSLWNCRNRGTFLRVKTSKFRKIR